MALFKISNSNVAKLSTLNGDYEVLVKNEDELKKLFELIKQSYNYNK